MRVLVTGKEGQLARSMAERGHGLSGIDIVCAGRPQLDLELSGSAARLISQVAPDVVINAAAYTAVDKAEDEPERAFRVNAQGAEEVAAGAAVAGARMIQISTDYVFDGSNREPYSEDAPTAPLGVYGRSKLEGEQRVRQAAPDHLILRTAWVYSPFGHNFVKTMIRAATQRELLTVVDDQRGNPSSALDLADGLIALLEAWRGGDRTGVGETYHLAGTGETSWCGFAGAMMEECARLGLPAAEVRPIRTADWPTRAARPASSTLDCGKYERDFGFRMPYWRHALPVVVERIAAEHRAGR